MLPGFFVLPHSMADHTASQPGRFDPLPPFLHASHEAQYTGPQQWGDTLYWIRARVRERGRRTDEQSFCETPCGVCVTTHTVMLSDTNPKLWNRLCLTAGWTGFLLFITAIVWLGGRAFHAIDGIAL